MKRAYGGADLAIQLSRFNPPDGEALGALRTVTLPYGIADTAGDVKQHSGTAPLKLLYVGHLGESKGVLDLLQACHLLLQEGLDFQLDLLGKAQPLDFEQTIRETIVALDLDHKVFLRGECMGDDKWQYFRNADIFCFPSFYEMETFGIVVLEAMQFGVPVVGTRWRGIQDVISDGETGFLVDIRSPAQMAQRIQQLAEDEMLRGKLGGNARRIFLERYSLQRWIKAMEDLFCPQL